MIHVEIWSDIVCPFCYIGKRRFEQALLAFDQRNNVRVEWKSYQLDPHIQSKHGKSLYQYLGVAKGWSLEQVQAMSSHVTEMARREGLAYRLDLAVAANSLDAHRLAYYAKQFGKQDEMVERLFRAYFCEGQDIAERKKLVELASEIGLDKQKLSLLLSGDQYADAVADDIQEAGQLGLRGVPFFVFNRKYIVSGAQPVESFLATLDKASGKEKVLMRGG